MLLMYISRLKYFGINFREKVKESESHSAMSNYLQPQGLYRPRNSPGQNTGVGSHSPLQGIFPTQGSSWMLKWLSGKQSACQCRRQGFDPGLGRSLGVGNGNRLQYSCLENFMYRGARQAEVYGVTESDMTRPRHWPHMNVTHRNMLSSVPGLAVLSTVLLNNKVPEELLISYFSLEIAVLPPLLSNFTFVKKIFKSLSVLVQASELCV